MTEKFLDMIPVKGVKMRNNGFQVKTKRLLALSFFIIFTFVQGIIHPSPCLQKEKPQNKIEKPKIFRDDYPIISESDLYCSFFVLEKEMLDVEIVSAEKGKEKILLSDADVFYINKGKEDGFEINQVFLIIEVGQEIKSHVTKKKLGYLGLKRGRARIVDVGKTWGKAVVEKSCGQVKVGNFLVPFIEKEVLLERKPASDVSSKREGVLEGNIIYLERNYQQIARGQWALIDLGREDGLYVGERMIIIKTRSEDLPPQAVGELIIIDTQTRTSTVKIISSRGVIRAGYTVKTLAQ
ncbi:MAG: hypothetical protein ACETWK_03620 [Candidatus Aminicenantaceae bacterium]